MCGITGYIGDRDTLNTLLDSLERVTYRGYDSFGVAVLNGGGIQLHKATGTVEEGRSAIRGLDGTAGIGHTRWATVGKVSQKNAHPHIDCSGQIAVVHNGDIDNYHQIRRRLKTEGHVFRSETDSEVISHLIETYNGADLLHAVRRAVKELQGSYAIVVLRQGTRELVAARRESPLVLALGEEEVFAASDVPAVLPYTNRIIYLEDGDVARLSREGVEVWSNGHRATRKVHQLDWSVDQLDRSGFEHFMLKEIHEQPQAMQDTIGPYLKPESPNETNGLALFPQPSRLLLLGCGTSYHACLIGKQVMERVLALPVDVQVASEYLSRGKSADASLAVALSQSGETADTLSALRQVVKDGYHTLAITNVTGSSLTRISDSVLYTQAGPEVAVAATKTFISQLAAIYLLGFSLERKNGTKCRSLLQDLQALPNHVRRILSDTAPIERVGRELAQYDNLFLIARGLNFPVALEGALKFKEIAYVHAEGCPAGELKHGPFALLGPEVPVIAIVAPDEHRTRMLTAIREIAARGSTVIAITDRDDTETRSYTDKVLTIPSVHPLFTPVLNTVVVQLLSYYCGRERGCPIDRPRNLAKSVTVP